MRSRSFSRLSACSAVFVVLLLAGCERAKPATDAPPDFRRFGTLPGLAKSPDSVLQNELARIQAEEGTPAQLAALDPAIDPEASAKLADQMPLERVEGLLEDIDKIYPAGKFLLSTAQTIRARTLLSNERELCDAAIAQFPLPGFSFPVDHCQGLLADLRLIDLAELAHRAKALEAHLALEKGDIDQARENASWLLHLDQSLANARHVVPRMKGATLRLEALRVVEAVVQHPDAHSEDIAQFRDLLGEHLAEWPDDANAWVGDRAQGLHIYEMIRHGFVLSVLTDKELEELSEEAGITATAKAIAQDVDADEAFYVSTLRTVIDACDKPYFKRRVVLKQIEGDLQAQRASPGFPLMAGRVLLVGLDAGHRRQAKDRAACEGWLIALSLATATEPPAGLTHNPETGKAYEVETEETRIIVRNARAGESDEAIIVPVIDSP